MRIAVNAAFWHLQHTGSGQYVRSLLQHMAEQNPQESLHLCLRTSAAEQADAQDGRLHTHNLTSPFDGWQADLAKVWFEQLAFPRACRDLGADVAHVPYFAPPLRPTCPTVVTIHDVIPLLLPAYRGSLAVRAYTRLVSNATRQAALILTDSQASARDIGRLLHVPSERLRVIYLAADQSFRPLDTTTLGVTLERLKLPSSYLLYLGGFDQRKNVSRLIAAYAQVCQRLAVPLVIAGKLPSRHTAFAPDPRVLAQELHLQDQLIFAGWIDEADKPALYAGARALVFPSQYEGFGLPVLEALSCGTPAIIGTGSSLEEIGGPGALAVAPDDIEALAKALVLICQDDTLHRQLAQAGLMHARRFGWQVTAQQTLQAYRDALA